MTLTAAFADVAFPAGQAVVPYTIRRVIASLALAEGALRTRLRALPSDQTPAELGAANPAAYEELVASYLPADLSTWIREHGLDTEDHHLERRFIQEVFYPVMGRAGLADLTPQLPITRDNGRLYRLDFAHRRALVAIEVDGHTFHAGAGPARVAADTAREGELRRLGWTIIRFTTGQIERPLESRERLRRAFADTGIPIVRDDDVAGLSRIHERLLRRFARDALQVQAGLLPVLAGLGPTVRVVVGPGSAGAGAVAVLDLLEAWHHFCGLHAAPAPFTAVELVAVEPDADTRALAARAIAAFLERPAPLPALPFSAESAVIERYPTSDGRVDLVVVPDLEEAPPDAQVWDPRRLSPTGRLVWVRPAGAGGAQPPTVDLPNPRAPTEATGRYFLWRFFGFSQFRPGQWPILDRALRGVAVLGVLSTGAGKSVCFQLAALLLPGLTVVVSPLVSLISDQLHNLAERGLGVAGGLAGSMSQEQQEAERDRLRHRTAKLFYLSPERLQMVGFVEELQALVSHGGLVIRRMVVDEAHIASEWGHDFRPSYLDLPSSALAAGASWILLTATASKDVRADLVRMFGLRPDAIIAPESFDRPELAFEVVAVSPTQHPLDALAELFGGGLSQRLWGSRAAPLFDRRDDGSYGSAGLVFTPYTQPRTENHEHWNYASSLSGVLEEGGLLAAPYHSRLDPAERNRTQSNFKQNRLPLVVATRGFGTGIDKPNIRFTVHTTYPASLESYFQEAGRAGRDQEPARSLLLHTGRPDACVGPRPPCLAAATFFCPHGLSRKCSFAAQAYLHRRSYPSEVETLQTQGELFDRWLAPAFDRGDKQVRVPTGEGDARGAHRDARGILQRLASLQLAENVSGGKGEWYAVPRRPRRLDVGVVPADFAKRSPDHQFEHYIQHMGGCDRAEARRLAAIYMEYLHPKVGVRKANGELVKTKLTDAPTRRGDANTEHVLYRLKRLGVVTGYLRISGVDKWQVSLVDTGALDLEARLTDALKPVLEAADIPRQVRAFREERASGPTTRARTIAAALTVYNRAWYQRFEERNAHALRDIEAFAKQRSCRTQRLLGHLGAPPLLGPCGRCDVCGFGGTTVAQDTDSARAAIAAVLAADRLLEAAMEALDLGAAIHDTWAAYAASAAIDRLQARAGRLLGDRPDSVPMLLLAGRAQLAAGDSAGAEVLERAIQLLLLRDDRPGLRAALDFVPAEASLKLLTAVPETTFPRDTRVALELVSRRRLGDHTTAVGTLARHLRTLLHASRSPDERS